MQEYKSLSKHPRVQNNQLNRRAIVIGATGATGRQLINQLLADSNWDKITSIGRNPFSNFKNNKKFHDIVINSLNDLESTYNLWNGHDVFFNCIGTTRKRAGSAKKFIEIESEYSFVAAKLASNAGISHASIISAMGANPNQWANDWIHPLLYIRTMGVKENSLLNNYFDTISIFRPGMLIRSADRISFLDKLLIKYNIALRVDLLASAMIRDAKYKSNNSNVVYIGNKCIKTSIELKY